jgi:hypothetical protein
MRRRDWVRSALQMWNGINDKQQLPPAIRLRYMARGSKLGTTDNSSRPGYLKTWGSRPKDRT